MPTQTQSDAQTQATLKGRRVALARGAEETHTAAQPLAALGAEIVYYPCLEVLPPANLAEFDDAVTRLAAGAYDWLLLTTASAVIVLAERLAHLKHTPEEALRGVGLGLYGANTRLAAQDLLGVDVATVPETSSHRDLVHSLHLSKTSRVLLPLAAGYRADWADLLTTQGAQVTTVAAYRAHMGQGGDALPAMLWSGEVDAVAFNSENNVRYFAKRLQYEGGTLAMLDDVCVACIEPQTAAVARGLGLRVAVVPGEHTPEALATDLAAYFAAPRR